MLFLDVTLLEKSCPWLDLYQSQSFLAFRYEAINVLLDIIDSHPKTIQNLHNLIAGSMAFDSGLDRGEGLRDRLAKLAVKSPYDRKEFFPHGCIDGLITREAVHQELGAGSSRRSVKTKAVLESLVDFIMLKSRTVFAISICCGLSSQQIQEAMTQFRSLGCGDSELPIVVEDSGSPPSMFYSSTEKAYRKPWNHFLVRIFCSEVQWMFLAPVFSEGGSQLRLHSNAILPFTGVTYGVDGAFSEVHGATIHPAHRNHNVIQVRILNIEARARRPFHKLTRLRVMVESLSRSIVACITKYIRKKKCLTHGLEKLKLTERSPSSGTAISSNFWRPSVGASSVISY